MELTHDFTVPASVDDAWATFMDLERVGSCFPGATVTSVDESGFAGTVKVKLGPIALQYSGTGQFLERDDAAHRAVIEAKGKDKRGNGTAGSLVTLTMAEVRRVPGTFGDPVRVIQSLPGAARAPFGTGLLVLRGANPEDSNVYVDGVEVPLVYHLNSALDANSAIWDNLGFDQKLPIHALLHHAGCAATLSNFIVSGLLDTYEDLKIGLIESGMGWVPFWLEGMDHQLYEFRTRVNRGLKKTSKEYFAKNFWVSFWFEDNAPKHLLDAIGVDRVMWSTDFPHNESTYGYSNESLATVVSAVGPDDAVKIVDHNIKRYLGLS